MNPEPAITRMKERDLDIERERGRQTGTKRKKRLTCPVKTQYCNIEKDIL